MTKTKDSAFIVTDEVVLYQSPRPGATALVLVPAGSAVSLLDERMATHLDKGGCWHYFKIKVGKLEGYVLCDYVKRRDSDEHITEDVTEGHAAVPPVQPPDADPGSED